MASKRVLVVDDNCDNLVALCEILTLWGYDVERAEDGASALRVDRTPDVVVLDLSLRDCDALDVVRAMKQRATPVVAFSGWYQLEQAARAAGADAFVLKPDIEALERCVRALTASPTSRNDRNAV